MGGGERRVNGEVDAVAIPAHGEEEPRIKGGNGTSRFQHPARRTGVELELGGGVVVVADVFLLSSVALHPLGHQHLRLGRVGDFGPAVDGHGRIRRERVCFAGQALGSGGVEGGGRALLTSRGGDPIHAGEGVRTHAGEESAIHLVELPKRREVGLGIARDRVAFPGWRRGRRRRWRGGDGRGERIAPGEGNAAVVVRAQVRREARQGSGSQGFAPQVYMAVGRAARTQHLRTAGPCAVH